MSMLMRIAGRVRGLYPFNSAENREDEQIAINNRGDVSVVQGLPELTELVRLGDSWQVATTTGIAALVALPTTASGLSLWNGEPANGKCYAIDSFGSWEAVADATQADATAIFAQNSKTPVAAPATAGLAVASLSGRTYGGKARTVTPGVTLVADGWYPHNSPAQMAAGAAGAIWKVNEVLARGLYLVPPGGMFNVVAVKGTAAALDSFYFIRWHEVQILYKS